MATALKYLYTITTEWSSNRYLGLSLNWDYEARTLDMSMSGYIDYLHICSLARRWKLQIPTSETLGCKDASLFDKNTEKD
jgi:hypothetical protein